MQRKHGGWSMVLGGTNLVKASFTLAGTSADCILTMTTRSVTKPYNSPESPQCVKGGLLRLQE